MKKPSKDIPSVISSQCLFCELKSERIIETKLAYAIFDKFPVTQGHSLVIPKNHISNYFELDFNAQISIIKLVNKLKEIIDKKFNPDGYNIGINIGDSAGQTINHVHIHVIPRYKDDIPNPIGGVRNIIPPKGDYTLSLK